MKKMLLILNPQKRWQRALRRAIIVGVLSFVAVLINAWIGYVPVVVVPILTALGAYIDKYLRDNSAVRGA